jgi:hypothetical protein
MDRILIINTSSDSTMSIDDIPYIRPILPYMDFKTIGRRSLFFPPIPIPASLFTIHSLASLKLGYFMGYYSLEACIAYLINTCGINDCCSKVIDTMYREMHL